VWPHNSPYEATCGSDHVHPSFAIRGDSHSVLAWACSDLQRIHGPDWMRDLPTPPQPQPVFGEGFVLERIRGECDFYDLGGKTFGNALRDL